MTRSSIGSGATTFSGQLANRNAAMLGSTRGTLLRASVRTACSTEATPSALIPGSGAARHYSLCAEAP
jgi:hypothetical protein